MKQIFALLILVYSLSCSAEDVKYHINNMFSISVSDKMEMRKEDDAYTKWMNDVLECSSDDKIVFQQKGLADFDQIARAHYARIIIKTEIDEECAFPVFNDADIPEYIIKELENACIGELASGQSFLTPPKGKVEEIGNGVRIKISYRRSGTQGAVNVRVIYIFNYRYAAKIIASYRESEESIWKAIIEKAINSIEWDETFITESVNDVISQKEPEFVAEVKSADSNEDIGGFLAGACLIVICIFLTYHLYQTKRVERQEREQKKTVESIPLVTNNESDDAESSYENHRGERAFGQLKSVEQLEKQVSQKVENIAVETKKAIDEYAQPVSGKDGVQIESVKKTDSVLKREQPISIEYEVQSEIKVINDRYQHGIIPEQKIIQTNYSVPNVKKKEGYYCFTLFPKTGTTVFPYRRRRIEKRGYTETGFEKKLIAGLVDFMNYKVLGDVCILPVEDTHPYEPDIAIIEKENHLGIRIDIEIDEPYTGYEQKAIHFIGCGDEYRDANLCNLGWIVIRFSEKQVYTEAEKCIDYIKYILSLIDNTLPHSNFVSPQEDKKWTSAEAVIMAAKGYREAYLHHQFNKPEDTDNTKLTKSDIKQTELEKKAAKQVQTVPLPQNKIINIDDSATEYSLDNRLRFEPKEHIYVLDGVLQLKAVSDVIAYFFSPFNILIQSERYAYKNGMSQTEVIEMWDAKGVESRDVGTFLHEQIEKHLKGKKVLFDYPFEYNGEIVNYKKTVSIKKEFGYFIDFMRDTEVKPFRSEWRIFDEKNKIAGTIDLICRNGSQFDIYDWKRSTKSSPNETVWQHGINGLEHVPDISFYKYSLQQNLYKYILENNYDIKINKMYLIVLHPEYERYIKYEVPRMDKEITIILNSL